MKLFKIVLVTVLLAPLSVALPFPVKDSRKGKDAKTPSELERTHPPLVYSFSPSYPVLSQKWASFSPLQIDQRANSSGLVATSSDQPSQYPNTVIRPKPIRGTPFRHSTTSAFVRLSPSSGSINRLSSSTTHVDPSSSGLAKSSRRVSEASKNLANLPISVPSPRTPISPIVPTTNVKGGPLRGHALYRKAPVVNKEEDNRKDFSSSQLLDPPHTSSNQARPFTSKSHQSSNPPFPSIPVRSWPYTLESLESMPMSWRLDKKEEAQDYHYY